MKCARLKERCEWPEVGGPGPVVDKGKGKAKEVVMLPRGGEKRKKKKTVAKVVDDDEIVEVPGPLSYPYFSQSQLRSNLGPPDLSLGIKATPDLVRPSPAP